VSTSINTPDMTTGSRVSHGPSSFSASDSSGPWGLFCYRPEKPRLIWGTGVVLEAPAACRTTQRPLAGADLEETYGGAPLPPRLDLQTGMIRIAGTTDLGAASEANSPGKSAAGRSRSARKSRGSNSRVMTAPPESMMAGSQPPWSSTTNRRGRCSKKQMEIQNTEPSIAKINRETNDGGIIPSEAQRGYESQIAQLRLRNEELTRLRF